MEMVASVAQDNYYFNSYSWGFKMVHKKKELIYDLISLADMLDRRGEAKTVDKIDKLITALASIDSEEFEVEIPQEEKDVLDSVLKALQESLQ